MQEKETLYVTDRDDWRNWLEKNHNIKKEVWLIYYKKHTSKPRISYDVAVEEALCFGWIDSIVKRVDDEKYIRKFTPRTNRYKWSASNKRRARKMIKEGRMTEAGLAKIDDLGKDDAKDVKVKPKKKKLLIPRYIKKALSANKRVWDNFNKLAPSYRRLYIGWITDAKKRETRERRLKEAIKLLAQNKKLSLK